MEELAKVVQKYGDIDILVASLEGMDHVETIEDLIASLEDELSYFEE